MMDNRRRIVSMSNNERARERVTLCGCDFEKQEERLGGSDGVLLIIIIIL
jgi:hypothetical protein